MTRRLDTQEVLAALRGAPVLSSCGEERLEVLARATRVATLRARDVLWREGQPADTLGLLLHGRVAVERTRQRPVLVDVVGAGALLGEVAFTLHGRYQFDVRCLRQARVALMPAALVREAVGESPGAVAGLAGELARQVLSLSRRIEALSAGSVSQRLARVLLSLAERFGTPFPGGTLLPVRLRREDLAALAATTMESASRQISLWKRLGVLVPQPVGFLLRDLDTLRTLGDEATATRG